MQKVKVLMASSIKTVLWNARFSRILIYGYFEPIWDKLRPEHNFLFKSASTYCDSLNGEMDTIAMKYIKVHCTVQLQKGVMHLLD